MSTFLGIVIAAVSVFTLAVVAWAFIWAAKKDGEEDRAVQKRLGNLYLNTSPPFRGRTAGARLHRG